MTSPVSTVKIETEVKKLETDSEELEWMTPTERCDGCGSQAYYRVSFNSGHLFFCRHHYLKHEEKFFDMAEDIVDESELLVSDRS